MGCELVGTQIRPVLKSFFISVAELVGIASRIRLVFSRFHNVGNEKDSDAARSHVRCAGRIVILRMESSMAPFDDSVSATDAPGTGLHVMAPVDDADDNEGAAARHSVVGL